MRSHNECQLGVKFRCQSTAPKAITATAHKLALVVYNMLKGGVGYAEKDQKYYEEQYKSRLLKNPKKQAEKLGFALVEQEAVLV